MIVLSSAPVLSGDLLLFHAVDKSLSDAPIVLLYGACQTATPGNVVSNARIQTHVFSAAGWQSYPRLAVSPSSPLYQAVECLSKNEQGDEVCRALAYSLYKYFCELSDGVKSAWSTNVRPQRQSPSTPQPFSAAHAAAVTSQLQQVTDARPFIANIVSSLDHLSLNCVDVDLKLPHGSIKDVQESSFTTEAEHTAARFGEYAPLVNLFGECCFLPTAKMQRAPSRLTALSTKTTMSRSQKESLRRELCELLDTEESYVTKMYDLVQNIAAPFREQSAADTAAQSPSSGPHLVAGLFPPSLDRLLEENSDFLAALQTIVDDTEDGAIADIEATPTSPQQQHAHKPTTNDVTGVIAFADCLVEWLSRFSEPYTQYIGAHQDFGRLLKQLAEGQSSPYTRLFDNVGDQQLASLLIEPVQRLPRYSLYVENILKLLPTSHKAVAPLLKAKDIVASICASDSGPWSQSKFSAKLCHVVPSWPSHVALSRFITAVDIDQIDSPFSSQQVNAPAARYIGLLFAGRLALIRKSPSCSASASSLVAKLDQNGMKHNSAVVQECEFDGLTFEDTVELQNVTFLEFGRFGLLRIVPNKSTNVPRKTGVFDSMQTFRLGGIFEGRPARFIKEVVKARVEARFPETMRDGFRWTLRELDDSAALAHLTAVYDEDYNSTEALYPPTIRIMVDSPDSRQRLQTEEGAAIPIAITSEGNGFYRIEASSASGHITRDLVTATEFVPVLSKRVSNALEMRHQRVTQVPSVYLLHYNGEILRSLNLPTEKRGRAMSKTRSMREKSHSPVKALANLFNGALSKEPPPTKTPTASWKIFENVPSLRGVAAHQPTEKTALSHTASQSTPKIGIVAEGSQNPANASVLEDTLGSYILALHSRKGNVVGRSVSNRSAVDEAVVHQLYNAMLEQPDNFQQAAEEPVDVLFAAFERFLKVAWKEGMGPIFPKPLLEDLQSRAESMSALAYEEHLLKSLDEFTPQNLRALRAIIAMLTDLLEGMSNDGDRGALMVAMTEIVVCEGDPQDYVSLFDRLIEEHDVILGPSTRSGQHTPRTGSISSQTSRSQGPSEAGSKQSSFSKRLGFNNLSRENSKTETSSKVASVLRSLGKSNKTNESPSRPLLSRMHSVDLNLRAFTSLKPLSSDGSTYKQSESSSRPATGRSCDSTDIKIESASAAGTTPTRRKRRSSLSDLHDLPHPNTSPLWSSPFGMRAVGPQSSTKPTPIASPLSGSPVRSNAVRHKPSDKTASPSISTVIAGARPLPDPSLASQPKETNSPVPSLPQTPSRGSSKIERGHIQPVPRGVLSERISSGNTPPPNAERSPSKASTAYTSLPTKMTSIAQQSSKRLQDRFNAQGDDLVRNGSSLQSELAKIGSQLDPSNPVIAPDNSDSMLSPGPPSPTRANTFTASSLSSRLKNLENKQAQSYRTLSHQYVELERETLGALSASEAKVRELQLALRDADKENELLCERNNQELMRLWTRTKSSSGTSIDDEYAIKLTEALAEAGQWKQECAKLRREVVALRTQLRAHEQ